MHPLLLGILKKAPELIAVARQLAEHVRAGKKSAQLTDRVAALEQNEVQQAELVREMTRQIEAMGAMIRVLSRRLALALVGAVAALALAAFALLGGRAP